MARRFSSEVLALVLTLSSVARADSEADALVAKAIELRKEKRDAEALKLLREAWAKEKSPRTQAQLALAEQAVGAWVEAETDLVAALSHADDAWIAKNTEPLTAALEIIRSHLGWIAISGPSGAEVYLDGARVGLLPREKLRVVAKTVQLEVSAAGYVTARRAVEVHAGEEVAASFTLEAIPPPEPVVHRVVERVEAPRTGPSTAWITGVALTGAGIGALGVGTYFGVRTFARKSERDEHCTASGCDPDGLVADREARSSATIANVTLAVGVVATTVGVVLVLRERAAIAPVVGPRTAALSLHVAW